ncbi:UL16-binding protein 1-like [Echinops telfairi]|uniref:UL16-binding protein 1-like n=1 Tax=Echinops telfairi TaxID=9371 RepID=A0ABM0ZQ75_ECHTE|nr:UL16-binding protein 1-like [Echinops telfairi]
MAPAPGPTSLPGLLFLMQLHSWFWVTLAAPHSLCYNFTVMFKPPPGHQCCEAQGQVDGNTFLHYDCGSNEVTALAPLGTKVNVTKTWEEQLQTLRDLGDQLKHTPPGPQVENSTAKAPLTLQAKMCCQHEAGRCIRAFWQFSSGRQTSLLFDSETTKWAEVHPGAKVMKGEREEKNVTEFLQRVSEEDCNLWLMEFWKHWEKMLETTAPPPKATAQPKATLSPWIIFVTLTCSTLFILQGHVL